ncbi:MAG: hypothetical protein E7623_02865 [Ruminococcaceae bacterium]|nr:hypothetical protein [Oscillospiraceae bacterium]
MTNKKSPGAVLLAVSLSVLAVAVLVFAVVILISKKNELKAAIERLRNTFIYTCDDLADDEYDEDLFIEDEENEVCGCCDCAECEEA